MIIELNEESCSWCVNNRNKCPYNPRVMSATREAVRNISICTKAYCSVSVKCDYYIKDDKEYLKHNISESCG